LWKETIHKVYLGDGKRFTVGNVYRNIIYVGFLIKKTLGIYIIWNRSFNYVKTEIEWNEYMAERVKKQSRRNPYIEVEKNPY
jgi:hypothetical protein